MGTDQNPDVVFVEQVMHDEFIKFHIQQTLGHLKSLKSGYEYCAEQLGTLVEKTGSEYGAVLTSNQGVLETVASIGYPEAGMYDLEIVNGQGLSGKAIRAMSPLVVEDVLHLPEYICMHESIRSELYLPITVDGTPGVINLASRNVRHYSLRDREVVMPDVEEIAQHLSTLNGIQRSLEQYADAVELSQGLTGHCKRVRQGVHGLGKRSRLSTKELYEAEIAAVVHDIGKIEIDQQVLLAPRRLTTEEMRRVRQHAEDGERILGEMGMHEIGHIIGRHHEYWDGSGYPHGLKGEEIPLPSRMICIVDAFDAMTEDRGYNQPRNIWGAMDEVLRCAGTQFDPHLAERWVTYLQTMR